MVAVILVNFSDNPVTPWTQAQVADWWNGPDTPNAADQYATSSWGRASLSADVFGWYTIPYTQASGCDISSIQAEADAAATSAGHNLSAYSHIGYLFPHNPNCGFTGTALQPGNHMWFNIDTTGCPGPNSTCQELHAFAHELGHNLGLSHGAVRICHDASGARVVLSNTCADEDVSDVMGTMGCCNPVTFSNIDRLNLGWIPASQLVTITTSQTVTVTDVSQQSSLVYRVPDGTGNFIYLENRAAPDPPTFPTGWPNGNLLLRVAPDINPGASSWATTYLLDGSPQDNDLLTPNAKALPVGQQFTLPNTPVTIANTGFAAGDNTVQITVGG